MSRRYRRGEKALRGRDVGVKKIHRTKVTGSDNEGGEKGSKTEKKKEFIKGAKSLREVGGEGESEFRGGTRIEKGFRQRTSRQERRK